MMRELRVEDALLYLDKVKMEFGDRPHIYNEFLDIMKTFKTQQIDTPGVIRRVSNLFHGNRRLVLGFNTFLPEGYKIELPLNGDGQPVAVYRAPGQPIQYVGGPTPQAPRPEMLKPQQPGAVGRPPLAAPPPPTSVGRPVGAFSMSEKDQQEWKEAAERREAELQQQQHEQQQQQQQQHHHQQQHQQQQQQQQQQDDRAKRITQEWKGPQLQLKMPAQAQSQHSALPQPSEQATHPLDRPQPGYQAPAAPPPMQTQSAPGMMRPQPHPQQQQQQQPPVQVVMARPGQPSQQQPQPPPPEAARGPMTGMQAQPQQQTPSQQPQQQQQQQQQPPDVAAVNAAIQAAKHGQQATVQPPVEFDHAINYVTTIKRRFAGQPETYKKFLEILHTYQKEQRGIKEVLDEVSVLFADHPDLLKEFTYFLPDAVQAQAKAQLEMVAKESESRLRARASKQVIMQQAEGMSAAARRQQQQQQSRSNSQQQQQQQSGNGSGSSAPPPPPFGATHGRSDEREREICRSAIYGSVSFNPVRPPRKKRKASLGSSAALTTSAASATAAKEAWERPTTIPEPPITATTAEAAFFERAKLHLKRKELAPDKPPGSRRHTPYVEFLKCLHLFGAGILNKEELLLLLRGLFMQGHAPKTGVNAGGGASNPGVANDAQVLLREFEEILVGRGPYADQENRITEKSKYGNMQIRDFDFGPATPMNNPTPSYRALPMGYPQNLFFSHSGQLEADASVLNNEVVCIAKEKKNRMIYSPEDYDGPEERQNEYEKNMFRLEDERYEVDMAIERNANAMRQVEPIAEEVTQLRDNEEKDGQPIGRMTYRLRSRQLNCSQINAIARLYGDHGDEVLQHLMENPVAVLPIVYQRLRQKDLEWRKAKAELSKRWNAGCADNHEGSLDVLCFENKKHLEKCTDERRMTKEAKNANRFVKEPSELAENDVTKDIFPEFLAPNTAELQFQYYQRVSCPRGNAAHKDAYQLLSRQLCHVDADGEQSHVLSRMWTEWMTPFFGYEPHWMLNECIKSGGKSKSGGSSSIVRFAVGQQVMTAYGSGTIEAVLEPNFKTGFRYKVSLPFVDSNRGGGGAFLRPESILYAMPRSGMVRKNNRMQPAKGHAAHSSAVYLVDTIKNDVMLGNDSIYRFLRLYCMLVKILEIARTQVETEMALEERFRKTDDDDMMMLDDDEGAKKKNRFKYDFPAYLRMVSKFLTSDMGYLDFETYCRSTSKEMVAQLTVLPKIVEKCADAMLRVASRENVLELFDYAQLKSGDLEMLRTESRTVLDNPCYRIQYDGRFCSFAYVEAGQGFFTLPPRSEDEEDAVMMDASNHTGVSSTSSMAAHHPTTTTTTTTGVTAALLHAASGSTLGEANMSSRSSSSNHKISSLMGSNGETVVVAAAAVGEANGDDNSLNQDDDDDDDMSEPNSKRAKVLAV